MPKQLYVNLKFTADADQAKKQIQDLTKSLQQISVKTPSIIDDQQLKRAASAANELQRYLSAAVNVDTGKINLNEFSRQLNKGGTNLKKIHDQLVAIGPEGVSAFNKLSQSLLQAETHSNKLQKKLTEFGNTLKNTFRWQISSSILHGLQGAVQSAFYYAQDLDKSLNNIRIVTGQSAEQMAQFAKQANAAAQALSTTTTAYTDAALIYYQQGLNDKEVKDRTDVTVKMANVTGESAQQISEQLTAVWNNFYDGSQSLESFSDKMVALGAATASSSSEISAGLNQFAATANTVGLSFDYAAAALATVTATTRQSANVVGNSFKTLFARLEGLSLGETLDDGTTLNKYSAALEKVGISIKDQNGELKAMDTILDELGARWQTLSKDQQVALAQTVGGVRQYTQLIALMDKWDFMQENLQTVRGSEGALEEQQKIYEEGWQAAKKRVQAAIEGIYDTLIDDQKLKKLYNFAEVALNSINGIIKGLGGIPGILTQIMSFVLQIQAKNMPAYVNSIVDGFNKIAGRGVTSQQGTIFDQLEKIYSNKNIDTLSNPVGAVDTEAMQTSLLLRNQLLKVQNELSDSERQGFENQIQQIEAGYEYLRLQASTVGKEQDRVALAKQLALQQAQTAAIKDKKNLTDDEVANLSDLIDLYVTYNQEKTASIGFYKQAGQQAEAWAKDESGSVQDVTNAISEYIDKLKAAGASNWDTPDGQHIGFASFISDFEKFQEIANPTKEQIQEIKDKFIDLLQNKNINKTILKDLESLGFSINNIKQDLMDAGIKPELLDKIQSGADLSAEELEQLRDALRLTDDQAKALFKRIAEGHQTSKIEEFSKMTSSLMAFSGMATSITSLMDNLGDTTASTSQKISQASTSFLSLGMSIMRVSKMMEGMSKGMQITTGVIGGIILAIQIATAVWQKYHEAQLQAHTDQAEKDQEKLKSLQEENDELEKLSKTYDELLEKYKDSGEGKDELANIAKELVDKYDIENGHLLLLAGNYDALTEAIKRNKNAREGLEESVTGQAIISATQVFEDEMREGLGHIYDGQTYKVSNFGSGNSYNKNLSQAVSNVGSNYVNANEQVYTYQGVNYSQGNYYSLEASKDNLVNAYEDVQKIVNEAYELASAEGTTVQLQADSQYQAMVAWLEKSKSSYETLKSLLDTQAGQEIAKQASQYDVKTLEDFQNLQANLQGSEEQINEFLQGTYQQFYSINKAIEEAGEASHLGKEYIQDLYDQYGDLIFEIDWRFIKNEEDAERYIAYLQTLADNNPIKIKFDLLTEMQEGFKKGMNAQELTAFYKQYQEIFEAAQMSLSDFAFMSDDEREDWIGNQIIETKPQVIQALNEETKALQERYAYMKEHQGELSEEAEVAKERAQQLSYELDQRDKTIAQMEHYGATAAQVAATEAEFDAKQEELNDLYDHFPEILYEDEQALAALDAKIQENIQLNQTEMDLLAASAESFEQLSDWLEDGTINTEAFNRGFAKLRDKLDEDVDEDAFKDMSKYLQKNAKDVQGLSDQLLVNKKSAEAVAKAVLRYDSAIQKVTDHYDEWVDALDSGNEYEQAEALKEVRNNFNDILDLHFDSLSDEFVNNRENLDLMKQAAEGSEDAYNDLMLAARNDILGVVGLSTEEFDAKYGELVSKINAGIGNIKAGAYIDDTQAIQAMNELINQAGLTAEQATDLLASMGVDAEVEQVKVPANNTYAGATPTITYDYADSPEILAGATGTTKIPVPKIEYTETPAVSEGEATATALRVKSARKSSGGGIKQSLAPSGGGGGGGKSGGGGGGGSKKTGSAEHAKKAPNHKAEDRYHVINNQIEDLAHQYDKLSEAEERAFGKSKLKLMDQQKDKLMEQYKAQQQLRLEAEKYWKEDLENLQNGSIDSDGDGKPDTFGASRYGMQVELDENGTITNYDALLAAADQYYNDKVEEYNQWLDDNYIGKEVDDALEEEKKQREERIKDEETYRENFLGLIDQYEDTQDKVQEELNKEIEAYHAVLDKMLEKTEYAVQVRLDVDEDSLKLLDFLMKTLEDNPYRAAEAMQNLNDQFEVGKDKIETYEKGIEDLFNNHFSEENGEMSRFGEIMAGKGYGSGADIMAGLKNGEIDAQDLVNTLGSMTDEFTEKEIEDLRKWSQSMQDEAANQIKIRQELFDKLDDAINQTNDDLDRQRNKIENLNKVLDHYNNLIDLVGRDRAGLDTSEMIANAEHQLTVLNAQTSADKAIMEEAQAVYDRLLTEQGAYEEGTNEWVLWKKRVEEAEDRLNETTENYYSSWEAALEAVSKKFDDTMKWMAEDYSKTLGGTAGSLEGLQNLMDQYEKTHSTYVPEYERVYQLNKLNAEAIKAIDETNNIKAKQELQKYQQKILDAQESGREMSEYELQNLEKELALRQAALALEEATNVKSQVRMQRDNEGNYSYVYTADESAVGDAEANYRDKLYEMQKANAEYINELQTNIVSLQQDYINAVQQAAEIYGIGTDEYYAALDKINTYYNDAMKAQYAELELAMDNNQDLQAFDAEFHHRMTGDKMVSDQGYITEFSQTLLSEQSGLKTSEDGFSTWKDASTGAMDLAKQAAIDYNGALETAMNAAGTTLGEDDDSGGRGDLKNFGESAKTAFKEAAKAADNDDPENPGLKQTVATMAENAKNTLLGEDGKGGLIGDVSQFCKDMSKYIKEVLPKITNLSTNLNTIIADLAGVKKGVDDLPTTKEVNVKVNVPEVPPIKVKVEVDDSELQALATDNGGGGGDNNASSNTGGGGGGGGSSSSSSPQLEGSALQQLAGGDQATDVEAYLEQRRQAEIEGAKKAEEYKKQQRVKKLKELARQGDIDAKEELRNMGEGWATGGYTGAWGPEGKLAILHEKELILNKEDTENMLAAVSMIRQISSIIDLNAQSAGGAFSSLFSGSVFMNSEPLQQDVHITAEFPNATDRDEILAAFDNVINLASQYANRKGPSIDRVSPMF